MITIEDLKEPKTFSDFVEKMEAGKTSEEEEKVFEQYLDSTEQTVKDLVKVAISGNNSKK